MPNLDKMDWNMLLTQVAGAVTRFAGSVFLFLIILIVGFWITGIIEKKILNQASFKFMNPTIQSFSRSFLRIGMKIAVWIIAITSVGVDSGSIIAVLGSAGLAIGLALQGSLSNLASGVLILTNKPFVVEDYIELDTISGTCVSIGLFYTRLKTADGKAVYVPNSTITTSVLTNYSVYKERRMDIEFGVGYSTDVARLKEILGNIAASHSEILQTPAPIVAIIDFAPYSLTVRFRFFVQSASYWDCYNEIYTQILEALYREKIEIPYPKYVIEKTPEERKE